MKVPRPESSPDKRTGKPLARTSIKEQLINLGCFFDRITAWDYPGAPGRPLLHGADLPRIDRPLPRFLDDAAAAKLARATKAEPDPLARLCIEILASWWYLSVDFFKYDIDSLQDIRHGGFGFLNGNDQAVHLNIAGPPVGARHTAHNEGEQESNHPCHIRDPPTSRHFAIVPHPHNRT